MSGGRAIYFVCQQAMARMTELSRPERLDLLAGLKLMLPAAEFEQCCLVNNSISEQEDARRRTEEAQLILGELLAS